MSRVYDESLGLMPGRARSHWRVPKKQTEQTESKPEPSQEEQTFAAWKEEMRRGIRAPSWTYPDWTLAKADLAERECGDDKDDEDDEDEEEDD